MFKQIYDFTLYSHLGIRKGTLELQYIEHDHESYHNLLLNKKLITTPISGYLNIFGHKEPISGELLSDGTCHLKGNIITLVSTFPFEATGEMKQNAINLMICMKHDGYDLNMKGIAVIKTQ